MKRFTSAVAGLMLLGILPLSAEIYINFNIPGGTYGTPNGAINYDGAGGALFGTNILVSSLTGINTTFNAGTMSCLSCVLNFTTGLNLNEPGSSVQMWDFGGGPSTSFTVTGMLPAAGINTSQVLLAGYFGVAVVTVGSLGGPNDFRLLVTPIIDQKNPLLISYLMGDAANGPPAPWFSGTYTQNWNAIDQFVQTPWGRRGFSLTTVYMQTGLISNDASALVPEPSASVLFSTVVGALGLLIARRRKMQAA